MRNHIYRFGRANKGRNTFALHFGANILVACLGFILIGYSFLPILAFIPSVKAAVIRKLPFSATLKTAAGITVSDGNYSIQFNLYTAATGGTAVWTETQTVAVASGVISANLGDVTEIPTTLTFNDGTYYLGVKVGSDPEASPRRLVGAVPLALNAASVGGYYPGTAANQVLLLDSSGNVNIAGSLQGSTATVSTLNTASGNLTVAPVGGTTAITGILTVSGATTFSKTGANSVAITGAPAASATSSLLQLGSAISGGSANGTFIGVNAASGFAGNLLDLQVANSTLFKVQSNGVTIGGSILPASSALYDLGSSSLHFANAYIDNIVVGTSSTSGTTSASFTLNQNASGDADSSLLFYRGGALTSARLLWNSTSDTFDLNNPARIMATVPASANYGQLSVGSATTAFDGSTVGFFVGSASGTQIAVNAISGFGGNLADWQVAGSSKLSVTAAGALTTASTINGATLSGGTLSGSTLSGTALTFSGASGAITNATTDAVLTINANGTGTVAIGGTSTGDVTLAGGSGATGCTITNSTGALACSSTINGLSVSSGNITGQLSVTTNGAASTPAALLSGTWYSGGTSTTTKPQFLVEPTGTTSTGWSTSGTGFGVNAASGFTGNLLDLQLAGTSKLKVDSAGQIGLGTTPTYALHIAPTTGVTAGQTAFIRDVTATTGATGVVIQGGANQGATDLLNVKLNDGTSAFSIGNGETVVGPGSSWLRVGGINPGYDTVLTVYSRRSSANVGISLLEYADRTHTSGTGNTVKLTGSFAPTSGTGLHHFFELAPTVNQTGGATGITRGLYINPTLTATADWRALEVASGRILVASAVPASANYGLVAIGSGPFDGATAGFFVGSSSGTQLAVNAASGFAGNLADLQVAGSSKFLVTSAGAITTASTINGLTVTNNGTNTLNIAAGKSLTASNSLTLAGTDSTTITFPGSSATVATLGLAQTFTAAQTITPTANSAVALTVNGTSGTTPGNTLTLAQGTITTTAAQALGVTATWNDAGTTHTLIKANLTDTASAAASLLFDLQVAAASKLSVTKAGALTTASTINSATISGGTLSAGTVSGGSLSATAVNGLSVASGTVSVGTWNGTAISPTYGGTGLNSSASTGVATVSSGTWSISSSLGASLGGTGITSYAVGDLIYASGATTLAKLADVATGSVLISGGVGVAPSWSATPTVTTLTTATVTSAGALAVTSAANGNISFTPNGTGDIRIVTSGDAGSNLYIGDGGTTNYAQFDTNGALSFAGSARPYTELILNADDAIFPGAAACASGSNAGTNHQYRTVDCGDATGNTDEAAFWQFKMPQNYVNASNIQVDVYWITADTSGKVDWEPGYIAAAAGSATNFDTSARTDLTGSTGSTVNGTANAVKASTYTLTSPTINADDIVSLRLNRDASDTTEDTAASDARVINVRLKFLAGS